MVPMGNVAAFAEALAALGNVPAVRAKAAQAGLSVLCLLVFPLNSDAGLTIFGPVQRASARSSEPALTLCP